MIRLHFSILIGFVPDFLQPFIRNSFLCRCALLTDFLITFLFVSLLRMAQLRRLLVACDFVLTEVTSTYIRRLLLALCAATHWLFS